ncbi:MAG: Hint domain-containing protein [Pararhodobacter sp.]
MIVSIQGKPDMPGNDRQRGTGTEGTRTMQGGVVVLVFPASALPVLSGANAGDPLPRPADSIEGDYYRLAPGATPLPLALSLPSEPHGQPGPDAPAGHVGTHSACGQPGAPVYLHGQITLMAPDGDVVELLVLETEGAGRLALPLSPLMDARVYTQIGTDPFPGPIRLADIVAGAFVGGTRIAMADGGQMPVETLEPGMQVITRDHGVQPLRWRGTVRLRAQGGFAPVAILPGVMGNPRPLLVSPHHRLFLYRRDARALAGAAELLVQARHLADGRTILRKEGGVVTYHSLVFDHHEVIYAEGVPCESLLVCPATLTRLPADLAGPLQEQFPGLDQARHAGLDIAPEIVSFLRDRPSALPRGAPDASPPDLTPPLPGPDIP